MAYEKITDRQWDAMSRHLPRPAGTRRPRADDRRTVNAIFFVLITGCAWNKIPKEYGSKSTAHHRLRDWQKAGVWQRMLRSFWCGFWIGTGLAEGGSLAEDAQDRSQIRAYAQQAEHA